RRPSASSVRTGMPRSAAPSAWAASTMTSDGRISLMTSAASDGESSPLTGAKTAPSLASATNTGARSRSVLLHTATRSPGETPRARATWLDRPSSAPKVRERSPWTMASRSGTPRAAFRTTSPTRSGCFIRTVILYFQISVSRPDLTEAIASRAIERTVAERRAEYVQEIQRILDATYRVIERTGDLDPSLRDILREAKLSTQGFYRCFQSKDELLLLLLDDGRRRLVGYLEHRMARARSRDGRIRAWIEGVLAQASRPDAASRTRPFFANEDRLASTFADEHQASI